MWSHRYQIIWFKVFFLSWFILFCLYNHKMFDSRPQTRWFSCILLWKGSDCWYNCKQRSLSVFVLFSFPITLQKHAVVIQEKYGKSSVIRILFLPLIMYYIDVTFIFSITEYNAFTLAACCVVAVWQIGWHVDDQRLLLENNHLEKMILEMTVKTQSRILVKKYSKRHAIHSHTDVSMCI